MSAADFDDRQSVASAQFTEHAVNVVFHRLFRKPQLHGNFFVSEATADHLHQLLLSTREPELLLEQEIGETCSLLRYIVEQCLTQVRRADSLALNHPAHCSQYLIGGSIPE